MENEKVAKFFSGVLVGGMLLSFGGVALAGDSSSTAAKGNTTVNSTVDQKKIQDFKAERNQILTKALDKLVQDGTLTKDKANQIKAYTEKVAKDREARFKEAQKLTPEQRKALHEKWKADKQGKRQGKAGLFSDLVKNNTITQKQADTLKSTIKEIAQVQRQQKINDGLKSLVAKKTISQDQADKVLKAIKDNQQSKKAIFEKIKNMTPQERKQYFEKNKGQFKNPLKELVTNKTITQEQAKEIKKVLFNHAGQRGHHGFKGERGAKTPQQ